MNGTMVVVESMILNSNEGVSEGVTDTGTLDMFWAFVILLLGVILPYLVFKLVMNVTRYGSIWGYSSGSYYTYKAPKKSLANDTSNDVQLNLVAETKTNTVPSALEKYEAYKTIPSLENPIIDYMDVDDGYGAENDVFYEGDINISETNIDPVKKALFDDYNDKAVSNEIDKLLLRIDKVEKKVRNDNSILFEYRCPSCGQAYQCDDDYEGFIPHCPNCNSILTKQQVYQLK